jgi:hypothetical protein
MRIGRPLFAAVVLVLALLASVAHAHDASQHPAA